MQIDYFYSLTYRQFVNTLDGFRRKQEAESKERLIIMRKIAYAAILPHLKDKTSETDFMPFDWEKETIEFVNKKTTEELKTELQEQKEFWKKIDLAKAKNNTC